MSTVHKKILVEDICGGLNENGPTPTRPIGSSTVRRCGLLEWAWPCWRKCVYVCRGGKGELALRFQMHNKA